MDRLYSLESYEGSVIAAAAIEPKSPAAPLREERDSKLTSLATVISQIAIQLFFIIGSVFIAAAVLPVFLHTIAIPGAAIGTTALAGSFFLRPSNLPPPQQLMVPPLIQPIAPRQISPTLPAELHREAPPRLYNERANCAFNALAHFMEGNPLLSHWFRHPLPPDADMATFERFLAGYNPPDELVAAFRQYVEEQSEYRSSISILFRNFIERHVPSNNHLEFNRIQSIVQSLQSVQAVFASFCAAYDEGIANNRVVATSQELRLAVNRIASASIPPSAHRQVDAAEVMGYIFDLLPASFKMHILERTTYDTQNLPHIDGNRGGRTEKEERPSYLSLCLPKDEESHTLQGLLHNYCCERGYKERRSEDHQNRLYPAETERVFLEAPSALCFQIKRFDFEEPQKRLGRWFWPQSGGRRVKRNDLVEAPDILRIKLINGEEREYRLVSFVNHHGNDLDSGHYTADRRINGRDYHMDDRRVTLVDPVARRAALQEAYLLYYVPVLAQ